MMSLVAYEASSDEESDLSDTEGSVPNCEYTNHHNGTDKIIHTNSEFLENRPPNQLSEKSNNENLSILLLKKLPAPKTLNGLNIQEEDDEFLHKKATPSAAEKRPRGPVQIKIPSLSEFKDIDEEDKTKTKGTQNTSKIKSCGLLDILPKPKQEVFTKPTSSATSEPGEKTNIRKLIPDSVKNKTRSAAVSKSQNIHNNQRKSELDAGDSGESDGEDYFSLNADDDKLPEVSVNEINAMVAKRAAKMAEASTKFNETLDISPFEVENTAIETFNEPEKIDVDEKALHILVGSRAKRRKVEEVNVVDLSSEQVLPNKDEWLRTALASSTTYQPKGVLTDEEPAPGTRKKHQITYLAHQAKANELELQAMWAANRHTRRQTQSKYGF